MKIFDALHNHVLVALSLHFILGIAGLTVGKSAYGIEEKIIKINLMYRHKTLTTYYDAYEYITLSRKARKGQDL